MHIAHRPRAISLWFRLSLLLAALGLGSGQGAAQEVILYDFFNFGGANVRLTNSAPDLDAFNFDNDTESIRVISGEWTFHRDDDFGNGNGPFLRLGPGDYPNIEALGFPQDRMSSVRLVRTTRPTHPAPPPDCPPPYQSVGTGGRCTFLCAEGTRPDPASGECQCRPGLREAGTDNTGRRICRIATNDANTGNRTPGVTAIKPPRQGNLDALPGAPATPNVTVLPQGETQRYRVPSGLAFVEARDKLYSFRLTRRPDRSLSCGYELDGDKLLLRVERDTVLNRNDFQTCVYRMFGDRPLAPGWVMSGQVRLQGRGNCARRHGFAYAGNGTPPRNTGFPLVPTLRFAEAPKLLAQASVDGRGSFCGTGIWVVRAITLTGPANANWRDAFLPRGR